MMICLIALTGCAAHPSADNKTAIRQRQTAKTSAKIGRAEEKQGIMTSEDYLKWEKVGNKVSLKRRIDDPDLDWAISVMGKPSTKPAEVHIMMMSLFLTIRAFTPAQQQKISAAVKPLLSSSDKDEPKWAKAVLKKIS